MKKNVFTLSTVLALSQAVKAQVGVNNISSSLTLDMIPKNCVRKLIEAGFFLT